MYPVKKIVDDFLTIILFYCAKNTIQIFYFLLFNLDDLVKTHMSPFPRVFVIYIILLIRL